jgi:signal transduction histidine kinase
MAKDPMDRTQPLAVQSVETTEVVAVDLEADLTALTGPLAGRRHVIRDRALIGRGEEAEIRVPGDDVSRRQARIRRTEGGDFVIEDLKSRNGTLVNGAPVEVHVLRLGDKVQIGARTLFVFTRHDALEEQIATWQRCDLAAQITAGMVHDFNNYMCALLGYIEYIQLHLARTVPETQLREILETSLPVMEGAARAGSSLAQKVLQVSRAPKDDRVEMDLGLVVQEASGLLRPVLGPATTVELHLTPGIRLVGDRTELMQVLINLLLNARDAMPRGGTVRVETARCSADDAQAMELPPGEQVVVKICDAGCGMDEDTRRRIFEPLFTTKSPGHGTGLGLSMVLRIVERHAGVIRVTSTPGTGSEFALFFPAARAAGLVRAPSAVTRTCPAIPRSVVFPDDEE